MPHQQQLFFHVTFEDCGSEPKADKLKDFGNRTL